LTPNPNWKCVRFFPFFSGSVFAELKKRGLATSLSAGPYANNRAFSTLFLSVELTEEGLEQWETVVAMVGAYARMLKEAGLPQWIFEEVKSMREIEFKFLSKSGPFQ